MASAQAVSSVCSGAAPLLGALAMLFFLLPGCTTKSPLHAYSADTIGTLKETRYTHTIRIDAAAGRFEVDCSGFVEHVLDMATPKALADLRSRLPSLVGTQPKRPLAKHFVAYFQALASGQVTSVHWQALSRAEDLRPGDVVAWLMPADLESRNTGHVMIVREKARAASFTPITKEPLEWIVPVTDATSTRHGRNDSRFSSKATGVGTGEVVLVADAQAPKEQWGHIVGYRWSPESQNLRTTTVAMARPR